MTATSRGLDLGCCGAAASGPAPGPGPERAPGWQEVEAGRYMPRRTRGSFPGRELG